MKSVSFAEFDVLVVEAQRFLGSRLQSVLIDDDILVLNLANEVRGVSLIIDVRNRAPFFVITDRHLPHFRKQMKPIVLFLKAHGLGMVLKSVQRVAEYGRLIRITFSRDNEDLVIEAHLFPQGRNIKVTYEDLSIHLKKPQELTVVHPQSKSAAVSAEVRSESELYAQWREQFEKPVAEKNIEKKNQGFLSKKEAALEKLIQNQELLKSEKWGEFAAWLNTERTEYVPEDYTNLYDPHKNIIENIEYAFAQAKKNKIKQQHLQERIHNLTNEIVRMKSEPTQEGTSHPAVKSPVNPLAGAKGRTREYAGEIRAYIGKSGVDNLKLLRNSKPWYIWVHAKDWPSAHAIIALNKGKLISRETLSDVCLWVLKETLSDKQWSSWLGVKVDFLYAERRYVQSIKGGHAGLVRYSQAQTHTVVVRDI